MAERRPVIVIPARFSASASALRYRAEVAARALVEAVFDAGGEPFVMHPSPFETDDEVRDRLRIADGVLLPGGGDLAARWAGQETHDSEYDVDEAQDAFDLALARVALEERLPLLAICRGAQVVNVARGGDLVQDLPTPHRHLVHTVAYTNGSLSEISCYHHQGIGRLGKGLRAIAHAADGTIEALALDDHEGWFRAVQWHPEDTADADPSLFEELIRAARSPRSW